MKRGILYFLGLNLIAFAMVADLYDFIIPELSLPLILRIVLFLMTMFITAMRVFLCLRTKCAGHRLKTRSGAR